MTKGRYPINEAMAGLIHVTDASPVGPLTLSNSSGQFVMHSADPLMGWSPINVNSGRRPSYQ